MSNLVFKAKNRSERGSAAARVIRKAGRIPAVIYGKGGNISIDLDAREFSSRVKGATESTIVTVEVDGKNHETFIKDTQRNILNGSILHVDFFEVETGKLLRARVPLHIFGNPVGVRDGGVLEIPLHSIDVECLPKDLPPRIDVDIADLKANQSIHVSDLALGGGIKLISAPEQVVALVKFAKEVKEPSAEEAAAAEGAAAPADAAAKDSKDAAKDAKAADSKEASK